MVVGLHERGDRTGVALGVERVQRGAGDARAEAASAAVVGDHDGDLGMAAVGIGDDAGDGVDLSRRVDGDAGDVREAVDLGEATQSAGVRSPLMLW